MTRYELEDLVRTAGIVPDEDDSDEDLFDLLRDRNLIPEAAGMCC